MIDLDAYFARVGFGCDTSAPSLSTLNAIMRAHVETIPFENVDVLLGRAIELHPEALQRKLVTARRGGYCFEQNGLLLLVLEALGFQVRPLSARVRWRRPVGGTPPRTHLFLDVRIDGARWLADVGIGGLSLGAAIRFVVGEEQATPHEPRRIMREGPGYLHQARIGDAWQDVYEFIGEEMPLIDREVANWYTSTHPDSSFRQNLQVARALPGGGRRTLLNRELTERRPGCVPVVQTLDDENLVATLRDQFGLDVPAETRLRCPGLSAGPASRPR